MITIVHACCSLEYLVPSNVHSSLLYMYFPLMLYKVNENKYIQIGFMGTYLIGIKWHFVSVFNGDLSAAVHTFSSLNSSITIKGMAMTLLGIHVEFNT